MGEQTKIQWTDHTFNAWIGCEKVSAGCTHCYAEKGTSARVSASRGLPLWGPGSSRQITSDANWKLPLKWNRAAERDGVRRRVFCSSLSDVFEDRRELAEPRARLWTLVGMTPHLDWLLLTKRPENAHRLWSAAARTVEVAEIDQSIEVWGSNVWLGTTCEDQKHFALRWPLLARVPARVRFISHEPALGPLVLDGLVGNNVWEWPDWVITGGESGPSSRPYDVAWARSLIAQTRRPTARGKWIACFVKQLGAEPVTHTDAPWALHCLDKKGGNWGEWPEDLRVREWPRGAR